MALQVGTTIAKLISECKHYGIDVDNIVPANGKKLMKTDIVMAIREYFFKKYWGSKANMPKKMQMILNIESPMLCSRFNELKEDVGNALWDNNDWIAEEKIDGCRMLIICIDGKFYYYSRNLSVTDYLPIEYTDNIYPSKDKKFICKDFIIDCEIVSSDANVDTVLSHNRGVVTETQLQAIAALIALNPEDSIDIQAKYQKLNGHSLIHFKAFDCLYYDGKWLLDTILDKRKDYLQMVLDDISYTDFPISKPMSCISNKKAFYKAIIANGGEGVVLKNLDTVYRTDGNRGKLNWVKVKRVLADSLAVGDSIDAFVTGFEPGTADKRNGNYVGTLIFSVLLDREDGQEPSYHEFAHVAGLTDEERIALTDWDENGNPILKKEYYGKVAVVEGQCVSARSLRLRHARMLNWRPDKSAGNCVVTEAFLKLNVL